MATDNAQTIVTTSSEVDNNNIQNDHESNEAESLKNSSLEGKDDVESYSIPRGKDEVDEQITSSTTDACSTSNNVFVQPMLPPAFTKPTTAKPRSIVPKIEESSSTTVSTSGRTEKLSREKQEKYNAIISSLNYHPPKYGTPVADARYSLEVLKNGTIVDSVKFSADETKGYYIIGRVPGCDILAENPTVSRVHAVLQFVQCPQNSDSSGSTPDDPQETGLYLYDLKSTHGTFINKNQVFPKQFYRVRVGHVIKFGTSQRMYIVGGPSEDEEEESDKSVSELLNERLQKDLERKRVEEEEQLKRNPQLPRDVEKEGINWGMGEDADEESDMRINPFAMDYEASELTFDNPKKVLRSWFEREGYELEFEVREKGNGQYVCRIGLPLDGPTDAPVYAESEVKGKKKEAAHDASMKACQILDSHGLLRTSNQESKKRKEKRWEDEDYYSSDDDAFLDRTGSVEKKREMRMRMAGKIEEKVETYESLCAKYSQLEAEIAEIQINLSKPQNSKQKVNAEEEVDIDEYVKMLKSGVLDVKKLKLRLKEATEKLHRTKKLMDIAKPTELPAYLQVNTNTASAAKNSPVSPVVSATTPVKTTNENTGITKTDDSHYVQSQHSVGKEELNVMKEDESPVSNRKLLPERALPIIPLAGQVKPPTSTQQKMYGLIKASNLSSLKTTLKPPEPQHAVIQDIEEEADDSSDESEEESVLQGEAASNSGLTTEAPKNKRKRHRYRNQQKKQKPDASYDQNDPNYSVWVPPKNQSGDGKTSLNEKLGY